MDTLTREQAIAAVSRGGREDTLARLLQLLREGRVKNEDLGALLYRAWSSVESPEQALRPSTTWVVMFEVAGFTINGEPADRPVEPLRLYRGSDARRRGGMSWTADLRTAALSARHARWEGNGMVWSALVAPEAIYAVIAKRTHWEYVISTAGLRIESSPIGRPNPDPARKPRSRARREQQRELRALHAAQREDDRGDLAEDPHDIDAFHSSTATDEQMQAQADRLRDHSRRYVADALHRDASRLLHESAGDIGRSSRAASGGWEPPQDATAISSQLDHLTQLLNVGMWVDAVACHRQILDRLATADASDTDLHPTIGLARLFRDPIGILATIEGGREHVSLLRTVAEKHDPGRLVYVRRVERDLRLAAGIRERLVQASGSPVADVDLVDVIPLRPTAARRARLLAVVRSMEKLGEVTRRAGAVASGPRFQPYS